MVAMSSTFGQTDMPTPHGGPAFQGWRRGWGFGKARGPGGFVQDPAIPQQLRFTPSADRGFASSAFWKRKSEVGAAAGFGIGDRPDYGNQQKGWSVAPDNYGDVSKALHSTKRNATKRGITMKPHFPTMEQKYRDLSWPKAGPGPNKYNTSIPAGQSSWSYPTKCPAFSMGPRQVMDKDLKYSMGNPGPIYNVGVAPGKNAAHIHGTLYDISVKGRIPRKGMGAESPGPARYMCPGHLDQYGLDLKIANVKAPRRRRLPPVSEDPLSWSTPDLHAPVHSPTHGEPDADAVHLSRSASAT